MMRDDTDQLGLGAVQTREEFAAVLTRLRVDAGLTIRQVVERSNCQHGTASGWFAGHYLPTDANESMFRAVLEACGVTSVAAQQDWLATVRRIRPTTGRRRERGARPYRGLEPFHTEDSELFFGRTELTEELRSRVDEVRESTGRPRVLFVTGASGSGKSSLLRAGLLPSLRNSGVSAEIIVPGTNPGESLRNIDRVGVVVIDQFEETWTLCANAAEREEFLDRLVDYAGDERTFVLGLRADFYQHAAKEPALHRALATTALLVGPLSQDELRQAIVEPARKVGWTVEDDLVQLLILELAPRGSGAAHDVGALPMLSHTLLRVWMHASRRRMTVADYNAVGGIASAIERTAETVYSALDHAQQQIARRSMLRLLTVDSDTLTRRRVHRSELFFGDQAGEVNMVIERFAGQRLLTVEQDTVEITHEALIRAWSRLAGWVDLDRAGLVVHRQLTDAARVWQESSHDESALLGQSRLTLIQDWTDTDGHDRDLNKLEREYIDASLAHHQAMFAREARRTRNLHRLVIGLALACVMAVVLAATAFVFKTIADGSRDTAARTRDEALSRKIALQSTSLQGKDPALAAQLALAGYRVSPTVEARSALLDSSAVHTPVRLLGAEGRAVLTTGGDSTRFAVGRADNSVTLYRTNPASAVTELGHIPAGSSDRESSLTAMAQTSDGRLFARGIENTIELWEVAEPAEAQLLTRIPLNAWVNALAFSPDGRSLLAGVEDKEIWRFSLSDPRQPSALPALELPAGFPVIAFSPDGGLLVAAGNEAALRIWDWRSPEARLLADIPGDGSPARALAVRFSPDGAMIAIPNRANEVRRWRLDDPRQPSALPALTGFTSYVNDVDFSADGTRLAAVSSDGTTRVWTLGRDSLDLTLPDPAILTSVRFIRDGAAIVTAGDDGTARIWTLPGPVLPAASAVWQIQFDRESTKVLVAAGAKNNRAHLWDVRDPLAPEEMPVITVGLEEEASGAAALTKDGNTAAIGSRTDRVYLWNVQDPRRPVQVSTISAVRGILGTLAFVPDGSVLITQGQDDPIIPLWDVTNPAAPHQLSAVDTGPGLPAQVAVDRTGTLLAVASSENTVRVWDIRNREHPRELPALTGFGNRVLAVAFSPISGMLVAGGADDTARVFDLSEPERPRLVSTLSGPSDAVNTVAFSLDGRRVVGGGGGGGIWMWDIDDLAAPRVVAVLNAYPARVNDAQFGHDGRTLVAGGPNRTALIWQVDAEQAIAGLCGSGSATLTAQEWSRYLPDVAPMELCAGAHQVR
ncbi:hypothetical protein [Nocardia sp. NPDC050793]|uniref:nSTAND1 domain-containing NTPase n=1 Tax=Nocardia sp. NPDC050793 TaxID=3155159 RepID=UPI0033C08FE8